VVYSCDILCIDNYSADFIMYRTIGMVLFPELGACIKFLEPSTWFHTSLADASCHCNYFLCSQNYLTDHSFKGVVFSYVILRCSNDDGRKYQTTSISTRLAVDSVSQRSHGQSQKHLSTDPPLNGVHISLQQIVHRDDVADLELQTASSFEDSRKLGRTV
jgi:hypothetical protein